MKLTIKGVEFEVENFTDKAYEAVDGQLENDLANLKVKNRDAIENAFALSLRLCPDANPSDLWHHIVYRLYRNKIARLRGVDDAINSWVRASGDAFEVFFADYYNEVLKETDIRLIALTSKKDRIEALKRLGIYGQVGDSKLDTAIIYGCPTGIKPTLNMPMLGGVHMKVSLAERVSDDVPCSVAMMNLGFVSVLATLDVKSFPMSATISETRAYANNGELGTPDRPTDKRKYIEEHGSFDACFSYNLRTVPSNEETTSNKRIFVGKFDGKVDKLCELLSTTSKLRKKSQDGQ